MARYFVLGNGKILVCQDESGQIRDFCYPFVGQENHVNGEMHRFGIWTDEKFCWFDSDEWKKRLSYKKESLITQVYATNNNLGLEIVLNDTVHHEKNIFLRKIKVKNKTEKTKEVKLFLHQIFKLTGDDFGNTVYYDPQQKAIVFYKGKRYFLINGQIINKEKHGISNYAAGAYNSKGLEGAYVDAQDGKLSNNPIEHGSVDSVISFEFKLEAGQEQTVYYWICAGHKYVTISQLNSFVLEQEPENLLAQTGQHWKEWANRIPFDFYNLSENVIDLFKRSLLLVSTHIDENGAFIASGDSSVLHLQKDNYAYMWPRDGALIARSLDRAGYPDLTEKFFKFCCASLTKDGYLFHKYNPDGSLGSSWHAWIHEGHFQLPVQEDQIALVMDALWKHYVQHPDEESSKIFFMCYVKNAGKFLLHYFDEKTGLPKESYDLWEEKLGIHTFTCATVYAGLKAAGKFEEIFGTKQDAQHYFNVAQNLKEKILKYFYDEKKGFIKGVYYHNGELLRDEIIDSSSAYGIFEFKVLEPDDEKLKHSFELFKEKLTCLSSIGGYTRYENDWYYRINEKGPGNPWFITSLWLAEYYIALAKNLDDLNPAVQILNWVDKWALSTGVLSEQLNPSTGQPLSVAPLTWSHAAFVIAVNKYLEKLDSLGICKMYNPPKIKEK
jgi:GH15 family glucan-1,4-alpha-glucosidase